VASVVRIYYLKRLIADIDKSWIMGPTFAWSSLEPSFAIISACLPTFAPLFRGLRNKSPVGKSSAQESTVSGVSSYIRSGSNYHGKQAPSFLQGQSQFRIEDDEVQLTDVDHCRHTSSSRDSSSERSEFPRNITVKTSVQVVTTSV
jgi:hypothetical protein